MRNVRVKLVRFFNIRKKYKNGDYENCEIY